MTHSDCIAYLRTLPDASVDSCVTDPPYELGFMGKKWDSSGIAYSVELWREVLRALKPGAHLLAFGGTRTHHRMVCAIEDAGFEIRDEMQWLYGSGFPKSLDVSKAIDKAAGAEREVVGISPNDRPKSQVKGGKAFDRAMDAGQDHAPLNITAPATPAAAQWDGWGTALKPACEPICVARKPLCGTVAANVLAHGTGGINVDGCRIGMNEPDRAAYEEKRRSFAGTKTNNGRAVTFNSGPVLSPEQLIANSAKGRWPANVILSHLSLPIARLRASVSEAKAEPIKAYFHDYTRLQSLRERVPMPTRKGKERAAKVLRESVPSKAPDDGARGESSGLWKEAVAGRGLENETGLPVAGTGEKAERNGSSSVEGRETCDRGIRGSLRARTSTGTEGDGGKDGGKGTALHPGASAGGGNARGQAIDEGRDCSPLKRAEAGQPRGESGSDATGEAQHGTPQDRAGTGAAAGGESPLEILACDIPIQWSDYFELTGEDLGCVCTGTKRVKASGPGVTSAENVKREWGGLKNDREVNSYADADGLETVEAWQCVEGCPVRLLDAQSGESKSTTGVRAPNGTMGYHGGASGLPGIVSGHSDTGGASRFFYTAKSSKSDREHFNTHATVKPLALMRYLVRLVTPPGGVVLDMFAGSGTTLVAARQEGFRFLGCDADEGHVRIAQDRLALELPFET